MRFKMTGDGLGDCYIESSDVSILATTGLNDHSSFWVSRSLNFLIRMASDKGKIDTSIRRETEMRAATLGVSSNEYGLQLYKYEYILYKLQGPRPVMISHPVNPLLAHDHIPDPYEDHG